MRSKHQTWLVFALLIGMMVAVNAVAAEPVTLRVSHWLSGDAFQSEVARFEALHPHIKVEMEPRTWNEHHEKLQVEFAAGVGADVYLIDAYFFASLFASDIFMPLEDMVTSEGTDLSGFVVDPFFEGGYDGHLYALPLHHPDNQVLWANRTLLDEAGLAVPRSTDDEYGKQTWGRFRDDLLKLTQGDGQGGAYQYGLGPMGTLMTPYVFFAWNNGGELFDVEDHTNPSKSLVHEEAFVEAYEFLTDLVLQDGVSPLFGDAYSMFRSGQSAYQFDWSLRDTYADLLPNEDIAVFPLPLPDEPRKVNKVGGNSLAINKHTRHAEAAFAFVTWLTTDEEAIGMRVQRSGEIPAYMPQRHLHDVQDDRLQMDLWSAVMHQFEDAEWRPWWFGQSSFRVMSILEEATIKMLTGEASPAIALQQAAEAIDGVL